jgi:hypothetical protein
MSLTRFQFDLCTIDDHCETISTLWASGVQANFPNEDRWPEIRVVVLPLWFGWRSNGKYVFSGLQHWYLIE